MVDDPLALLFQCPRHPGGLRLLPGACAASWRRGTTAKPWDAAYRCRGCAVGAEHAGEVAQPAPVPARCCWCERPGQRLIWGVFCISCANRFLECVRGKDRRGNRPGLAGRLRTFTVVFRDAAPGHGSSL